MPRLTRYVRNAHSRPPQIQRQPSRQWKANPQPFDEPFYAHREREPKRITAVDFFCRTFKQRRIIHTSGSAIKHILTSRSSCQQHCLYHTQPAEHCWKHNGFVIDRRRSHDWKS
jgi:hypothetical protein